MKKLLLLSAIVLGTTAFATNATTFDTHNVAKPARYSRIDRVQLALDESCLAYAENKCSKLYAAGSQKYRKCVNDTLKYEC